MTAILRIFFFGIMMVMLSACSTYMTYDSKHACEKQLLRDRSSIAGIGVAAGVSHVADLNTAGDIASSIGGAIIGDAVGEAMYEPDGDNDLRPYRRHRLLGIFNGCELAESKAG